MPAVPYRFAGVVRQDGREQFLLAQGDRLIPVHEGQTLEGPYKVEQITSGAIRLRYLPLDREVTVRFPGSTIPASEAAQLSWRGPGAVKLGSVFAAALLATSGEAVRASAFELRFDPEVLEPMEVQAGRYYEEGHVGHRIEEEGRIEITASHRRPAPATNAELFVVRFRALKPAHSAKISLDSVNLQALAGGSIPSSAAAFTTSVQR